jgi:hypothetical protein
MRSLTTALVAALALMPTVARAADAPCLTSTEFSSLSSYALPSMIRGTAQHCASVLPRDAFLRNQSVQLASRYDARKAVSWPAAKAAFIKIGAATNPQAADIFKQMSDDALQPLIDGLIQGMIGQQLPTERCNAVDRLVMLLAPLPAESTAELIGLAAGFGAKNGKAKVGQFSICSI